ncbi:DNA methyltransferase [Actinoplanes missouriensis]|uniref:Eco57I restriction-modification methylase domain-containing protein n=1 Tax=Actinoplanes missouriensis TaxID=1866 RepID=UPI0033D96133
MTRPFRNRPAAADYDHKKWLALIEVSGPFLSVPVLRQTWPTLDALDKPERERLRVRHAEWIADQAEGQQAWFDYVLRDLLAWGDDLHTTGLDRLAVTVPEHEAVLTPSFALVQPGEEIKPDAVRVIGVLCPAGSRPTARIPGDTWAATPADRLAQMCRHHEIELGLATDGRFWTLVWAPRGGATMMATFDTIAWAEAAERDVVRAFVSLLHRRRFFQVTDEEKLVPLLRKSLDNQEEITEALGVQVRQAVELLVAAFGRIDVNDRRLGGRGLLEVDAHEVYRGAVTVMMRIVFLLFAEERKLLPADNELYAAAYSAGRLCAELEERATEGSEEDLEHSTAAWQRLIALFNAIYTGVDHPRLTMHAHDGSLFDPKGMPWLPLNVDDRTVLHMLRAVQYVQIGRGVKTSERRTVSFRTLDVEQIGYVYEGLLSFEGLHSQGVTVGLIGKEGMEEEVRLTDLEALAEEGRDTEGLAKLLAEKYKDSKIPSAARLKKILTPLEGTDREEARKKLLAVTGGDSELSERLLSFFGVIRTDLRDLPVVVLPGGLFVTESALRRNTGTHYTPRKLAEEIVEGALEPLVYEPGPLQTADTNQWKPKPSEEILKLKVADIAMGSAAFLVAAARYLGKHLLDAALREKKDWALVYQAPSETSALDADDDPAVIEARRQIIEHCLYGVDINPMAVEMAKLSLWLVSMDPQRPFTFLDDRLVAGDSLLGMGNLTALSETAERDKRLHRELSEVRSLRTELAQLPDNHEAQAQKKELLDQARALALRASRYADLIAGGWLASVAKEPSLQFTATSPAEAVNKFIDSGDEIGLVGKARKWLGVNLPEGAFERHPLHWPLEFPEVFDKGGFDAIIGNPPFLGGQKLTGALGVAYREYLVGGLGRGARGSADLVAYFLLRAHQLLNANGQTGLIATNTLAQGDTREVGLDRILADGVTLRRAVKSERWPSRSAALEYCAVWSSRGPLGAGATRRLGGISVVGITAALEPVSRVTGNPHRLASNVGISFQGSNILGLGFTLTPDEALDLVVKDERKRDVLFPYLNGQDLNSRPDCSGSRWVINFHDWSEARARTYPDCFDQVVRLVKPERDRNLRKVRRDRWWQFAERAPKLYAAIAHLERIVAITLVSKTVMPTMVPTGQVFSHALGVFATEDTAMLALLSSSPHYWWAATRASSMKADLRYTPSDVFETFAMPELSDRMRDLGDRLDRERRQVMLSRDAGLTATYKLVFDAACNDSDIVRLRELHREIDESVFLAYGWEDLVEQGLDYGFHPAGAYVRYTIGPAVQREILDRLLELNHARYAEEVAHGLHDKKGAKTKGVVQAALFDGVS